MNSLILQNLLFMNIWCELTQWLKYGPTFKKKKRLKEATGNSTRNARL